MPLDIRIPRGLSPKRIAFLALALGEVGTREKTGHNDGDVEKYIPSWAHNRALPWCAYFVGWLWHRFFGVHPYLLHIGAVAALYKSAQARKETLDLRAPGAAMRLYPGDAFIMLHGDGTGHTGLVLRVSEDGSLINTLEGNAGNAVRVQTRATADIDGAINLWGRLAGEHDPVGFERGLINAPFAGKSVAGTR